MGASNARDVDVPIDGDYVKKHFKTIKALSDRAVKADAIACEAETEALLLVRLLSEGWEPVDGQANCFVHPERRELMIANGRFAYAVHDRHVRQVK